jgi:hypothetical protein
MAYSTEALRALTSRLSFKQSWNVETLAGAKACSLSSGQFQQLDPGGAHRDVTLPAVAKGDAGYFFVFANAASGAENLVVKDAAASTIATFGQSKCGIVFVDSAGAWQSFGALDYAA